MAVECGYPPRGARQEVPTCARGSGWTGTARPPAGARSGRSRRPRAGAWPGRRRRPNGEGGARGWNETAYGNPSRCRSAAAASRGGRRRPGWPRRSPTRARARSGVPRRQGCRRGRRWTQSTGRPKSSADLSVRTDTGGHDRLDRRRAGGAARQGCVRKRSRTARKRRLRRPKRHRAEGRLRTSGPIRADSGTSRILAGLPCKQGVAGSSPAAGSVCLGQSLRPVTCGYTGGWRAR